MTYVCNSKLTIATFLVLAMHACSIRNDSSKIRESIIQTYKSIVIESYSDCHTSVLELRNSIDIFVNSPSEQNLDECKKKWKEARRIYGQTEAYRFYGGPIDDEHGLESYINAWPIDESFVDYTIKNKTSGIILDVKSPEPISREGIISLNEHISENSIFTGFHVIEFLLWGQDTSLETPGQRPYTDYVKGNNNAEIVNRRIKYIRLTADLLVEHIEILKNKWASPNSYGSDFVNKLDQHIAIQKIISGLIGLSQGELSGERMFVAAETQDQENEQSCFSDNTIDDIKNNFLGLRNVYYGEYKPLSGKIIAGSSLSELITKIDIHKSREIDKVFEMTNNSINEIPYPFDKAIVNSPQTVFKAVEDLKLLSDKFSEMGKIVSEN